MEFKNKYDGIDEFITKVIKCEAEALVGRFGFTATDRDDLWQDLHGHVLHKLSKLAKAALPGTATFKAIVRKMAKRRIKDIIRGRKATSRGVLTPRVYLDAPVEDSDTMADVGEFADLEKAQERTMGKAAAWASRRDLKMDVEEAFEGLPEPLMRLAMALYECGDLCAASKELGITRMQGRSLLKKLRAALGERLNKKSREKVTTPGNFFALGG